MRLSGRIIGLVILSLFVLAFGPLTLNVKATDSAQGSQISPALVELNAVKGKTYTVNLRVTNVTNGELTYKTSVEDFSAANETGTPKITDNNLPTTASIRTWVNVESGFTLGPHQERNIDAIVTIPSNAEAGGHYGVIRFSGSTPNIESTGVGISASTGVLMLIRVDGNIKEQASLASFYTTPTQDGKQSSIFEKSPVWFVVRIKNEGNVHIKPVGNIEVRDMFGGLVANITVNKTKSNVLPNSVRRFTDLKLDKQMLFGRYTANLTMGYGTKGQAITNTITFWVIPYKIILAAILVIITLVFIFRRMLQAYNKRIEEKIKNEYKNKNHKKG